MGFPRDHSNRMGNHEARAHYGNAVIPAMMCLAIGSVLQLLRWLQDSDGTALFDYSALILGLGKDATLVDMVLRAPTEQNNDVPSGPEAVSEMLSSRRTRTLSPS